MGFWERATGLGGPTLDLQFFGMCLQLHASEVMDETVFAHGNLALEPGELVELGQLLGLMPAGETDRAAWVQKVLATFNGARWFFELETVDKVKAALGVAP